MGESEKYLIRKKSLFRSILLHYMSRKMI